MGGESVCWLNLVRSSANIKINVDIIMFSSLSCHNSSWNKIHLIRNVALWVLPLSGGPCSGVPPCPKRVQCLSWPDRSILQLYSRPSAEHNLNQERKPAQARRGLNVRQGEESHSCCDCEWLCIHNTPALDLVLDSIIRTLVKTCIRWLKFPWHFVMGQVKTFMTC